MNQDHSTNSIEKAVLDKVREGKVRRRPRSSFIVHVLATMAVSVLLLVASAFVISFIIFSIHESGEQFLLGFGLRGVEVFLTLFPWLLVIVVIVLVLLLEWLLQRFKFGYRTPLLNIFLGIGGISILLGTLISFTPLHSILLGFADKDQLPLLGQTYEHIFDHHEDKGISRGKVISVGQDSFVMQHDDQDHDHDDATFTIRITPGSGIPMPQIGDQVLVFGQPVNDYIVAEHIQVFPSNEIK